MHKVYHKLIEKYPDYRFGYSDRGGLFWDISAMSKDMKRVQIRRGIEKNLPLQDYAVMFLELLKAINPTMLDKTASKEYTA